MKKELIKGCSITFDRTISEEEKQLLAQAIQRFRGVEKVTLSCETVGSSPEQPGGKIRVPSPPPGSYQQEHSTNDRGQRSGQTRVPPPPPKPYPQRSPSHGNISAGREELFSPPPPKPYPQRDSPHGNVSAGQNEFVPEAREELQLQRRLIDRAIQWGVENRHISYQKICQLSPEEIVEEAFALIPLMSREEQERLKMEFAPIIGQGV